MLRAIQWTFSFGLILFSCGCALLQKNDISAGPHSKVYLSSYDEVWRATQKALIRYPVAINNIDTGLIETEPVKIDQIWTGPITEMKNYPNMRYNLRVSVLKGKVRNVDSIRVTIAKNVSLQTDFFSNTATLSSDGYEEAVILYRIERELQIEQMLRKAFSDDPKTEKFEDL